MTSNRGAGFSSNPRGKFDPFNQGKSALGAGTGSSLLPKKQEPSAEEVRVLDWLVMCANSSCRLVFLRDHIMQLSGQVELDVAVL